MTNFARILAATAAIGSLAAPAAAQYQPQYQSNPYAQQQYQQQYGQQYQQQYGYGQQYGQTTSNNPIGQIIDQLLGNRYTVTDRQAVSQCAAAAVTQAQAQYGGNGANAYGQAYGQQYRQGYQQGFAAPSFRVTAISDVQRRSNGLRVAGTMSSGYAGNNAYGQNGYNGYNGYRNGYQQNQAYAAAGDMTFRCNVDYRGVVSGVRVSSNNGYRRY